MNKFIKIFIIILILILLLLCKTEYNYISYNIKLLLNLTSNKGALPSSLSIRNKIIDIISSLPKIKYTFIDFGCGEGDMIKHIYKYVNNVIGIELDKYNANFSKKRFSSIPKIKIKNINMIDYNFKDIPTIFYLYEPLWLMNKIDALKIYDKVIQNMSLINSKCYIIYVSGINPKLDKRFFESKNYKLITYSYSIRILGFYRNNIYVFQKKY